MWTPNIVEILFLIVHNYYDLGWFTYLLLKLRPISMKTIVLRVCFEDAVSKDLVINWCEIKIEFDRSYEQ